MYFNKLEKFLIKLFSLNVNKTSSSVFKKYLNIKSKMNNHDLNQPSTEENKKKEFKPTFFTI